MKNTEMRIMRGVLFSSLIFSFFFVAGCGDNATGAGKPAPMPPGPAAPKDPAPPAGLAAAKGADWPQWGGTPVRNMVSTETNLPDSWSPGKKKDGTEEWDTST